MPGEAFYEGLTTAEAVRKMAEHHAAPATRHLSFYEFYLLQTLADRLDPDGSAFPNQTQELAGLWPALGQVYSTVVSSPRDIRSLQVLSIPARVVSELDIEYLNIDGDEPAPPRTSKARGVPGTVTAAQAALTVLINSSKGVTVTSPGFLSAEYVRLLRRPADIERELDAEDIELINRVLFQPSVPVELSPPSFRSIEALIGAGAGAGGGTVVGLAHLHNFGPVAVLEAGMAIIVLSVSTAAGTALGRKLTAIIDDLGHKPQPTRAANRRGAKKGR